MDGFKKLLVPLDGSRLAEAVLPVAMVFAEGFGATVSLLHVMEREAPETIHGEHHLVDAAEAQAYLEKVADECGCEGVTVELHVHPNLERDVVASVIGHADEFGADLIILATHGSGGMRDILVGSIAQQVLRRGTRPVLLVKPSPGAAEKPYELRRILLPLDGSPIHDEAVLPVAESVAAAVGADIQLLVVVPTLSTVAGDKAAVATLMPAATRAALDIERDDAVEYLREVSEGIHSRGVQARAEVRRGDPAAEVVGAAESYSADLIVMATHGRIGLGALWQASVGAKILSRTHQPLLLVRARE